MDHGRRFGYAVTIVLNLIAFYILHHLLVWRVPFVTDSFPAVLWAFDLSLGLTIVVNALFIIYDPAWFRHTAQIALHLASIFVIVTLLSIFPFAFGPTWDTVARVLLWVGLFGTAIGILVDIVALVRLGLCEPARP